MARKRCKAGASPQQRAHAREQLLLSERLGNIVIGADLQADDPIHLLAARAHDDDRHLALGAQCAAQVQPVGARKHDVEQHEIDGIPVERSPHLAAVTHAHHAVAVLAQCAQHQGSHALIIFHDQDMLREQVGIHCHEGSNFVP